MRPRFRRTGKFVQVYSIQEKEVKAIRLVIKDQWKYKPIDGGVSVEFMFHMPIPKSTTKKRKWEMEHGEAHHLKKPDIDNLEKFMLDCMNGIVWNDDRQIVKLVSRKQYNIEPKTIIDVKNAYVKSSKQLEVPLN
jgi:Holliday junction resolvase RusA-like endonuclease